MTEERPARALIVRLKETRKGSAERPPTVAEDGAGVAVQFNPTSLRIERRNDTSGGSTTRAQRRQQPNEGNATLSLDLEFDTAEGGPDGQPLDVRSLTASLREFAEPPRKPRDPPPRMRFKWGSFHFDGIVGQITEELDYFAPDGMALRAKVSLSIKGQDAAFESNAVGPGARTDATFGAEETGAEARVRGSGPGGGASGSPDLVTSAQDGESVQQALSRMGLDPAAWRSAMAGLDSPLGLTAGAQLQIDSSASLSAGLGATAGFSAGAAAGASVGAGASAGLSAAASAVLDARVAAAAGATGSVAASASARAEAGFALSAAGGIAATSRGIAVARAEAGVATAKASFAVPGPSRPAGVLSAHASAGASAVAAVDARAATFGHGVPLKPPVRLL